VNEYLHMGKHLWPYGLLMQYLCNMHIGLVVALFFYFFGILGRKVLFSLYLFWFVSLSDYRLSTQVVSMSFTKSLTLGALAKKNTKFSNYRNINHKTTTRYVNAKR